MGVRLCRIVVLRCDRPPGGDSLLEVTGRKVAALGLESDHFGRYFHRPSCSMCKLRISESPIRSVLPLPVWHSNTPSRNLCLRDVARPDLNPLCWTCIISNNLTCMSLPRSSSGKPGSRPKYLIPVSRCWPNLAHECTSTFGPLP